MFCAKYSHGDHLTCHDDQLEGRRVAYILYLTPENWRKSDGGCLELFSRDAKGNPSEVKVQLLPKRNTLAFFEVSKVSFHQVQEVLTEDRVRMSLSGWFKGKENGEKVSKEAKAVKTQGEFYYSSPKFGNYLSILEEEFYSWLNPLYLNTLNQSEIKDKFEDESEISLPQFLKEEKYREVKSALESDLEWRPKGPPNRRKYQSLAELPDVIRKCADFLRSDAFMLLLSSLTGLRLHPLAEKDEESDGEVDPKVSFEVRKWQKGFYTLIKDEDMDKREDFSLDLRLFFGCEGEIDGGFTSYVAKNEEGELLRANPEENTLNLVYKDGETASFVKRIASDVTFFDISGSYRE